MECILWRCKAIFILGLSGNGTRIDEATANSAQSKFVRGVWVLDFDFRLPTPTAISAQIKFVRKMWVVVCDFGLQIPNWRTSSALSGSGSIHRLRKYSQTTGQGCQ